MTAGDVAEDGSFVAFGLADGQVALFEVESQAERLRFSAHEGIVSAVDVSPDGAQIATGGADGAIRLFDATTGEQTRQILAPGTDAPQVQDVCFSPRGTYLATHRGNLVWSVADGRMILEKKDGDFISAFGEALVGPLAGIGDALAEGMASAAAGPPTEDRLAALGETSKQVEGYAQQARPTFSFDERLVAFVGARGRKIVVRDVVRGETVATLGNDQWVFQDVEFVPVPVDERWNLQRLMHAQQPQRANGLSAYTLAVVDGQGELKLWSPADPEPNARLKLPSLPQAASYVLAAGASGEMLAIATSEGDAVSVRLDRFPLFYDEFSEYPQHFDPHRVSIFSDSPLLARRQSTDVAVGRNGHWACLIDERGATIQPLGLELTQLPCLLSAGGLIPRLPPQFYGDEGDEVEFNWEEADRAAERVFDVGLLGVDMMEEAALEGHLIASPHAPSHLVIEPGPYQDPYAEDPSTPLDPDEPPAEYVPPEPKLERTQARLYASDTGEELAASDWMDYIHDAEFSPDGAAVAFASSQDRYRRFIEVYEHAPVSPTNLESRPAGVVCVWDAATGEEKFRCPDSRYAGFSFSHDGRLIAAPRHRAFVVYRVEDGGVEFETPAPNGRHAVDVQFARTQPWCAAVWRSDDKPEPSCS